MAFCYRQQQDRTSGKVSRKGNTTNLDFARWKEIFGDEALTGALLEPANTPVPYP